MTVGIPACAAMDALVVGTPGQRGISRFVEVGGAMSATQVRVLQGTLDLLILKTLAWQPNHGFGILRHLETVTGERLIVEEGALYPALHRMREKGWIEGEWGKTENNRRALFYRLTARGRAELRRRQTEWSRLVEVMALALEPAR